MQAKRLHRKVQPLLYISVKSITLLRFDFLRLVLGERVVDVDCDILYASVSRMFEVM